MTTPFADCPTVDVLAIGTHPDDVEITCGGTLLCLVGAGRRVAILDFTCGQMGTRGSAEIRRREAQAAARALGVLHRTTLDGPDGLVQADLEGRRIIIEALRAYRPHTVLAPPEDELHPDHAAVGRLVSAAVYPAGFARYPAAGEPHRPSQVWRYPGRRRFEPLLAVNVSEVIERKFAAVRCYASQLYDPASSAPVTNISQPDFLEVIRARNRADGARVGARYAETFACDGLLRIDQPEAVMTRAAKP